MFDEEDFDAALARFDELQPQARQLENAATRVSDRYVEKQISRDWDAMAEMLADDFQADDRRPVVGGGVHGRDGEIANGRASADVGVEDITTRVIATRGEHLALSRFRYSGREQGQETFVAETLVVGEINADGRVAAGVAFDVDDIGAAFEELDARFRAGEAAAHAHTWSLVMQVQAAYNRHEAPPATADWVNIDHRRGRAFAPGDTVPYLRATYDVAPNVKGHIEAVHQLNNLGVVLTAILAGTSQEGFDAEWREIALFAFEGDMVSRFEIFDEADLNIAVARFEEMSIQDPPRAPLR